MADPAVAELSGFFWALVRYTPAFCHAPRANISESLRCLFIVNQLQRKYSALQVPRTFATQHVAVLKAATK